MRAANQKPRWGRTMARLGLVTVCLGGLLLPISLLGKGQVQAASSEIPGLSSRFSRGFQGVLGMNAMASWIGSRQLEKEIHKKVSGEVDVDLKPYSALDLAKGKLRRLNVEGHHLLYDNRFYASDFALETSEETPIWVDLDSGKLKTPVKANVVIRLREDDFNRSFETPALQNDLQNLRIRLLGLEKVYTTLSLQAPHVTLQPERLLFQTSVAGKGASPGKALPLRIETGLEPGDTKALVRLKDVSITSTSAIANMAPMEDLLEKAFSQVLKPSRLIPMKSGQITVQSIVIGDEDIVLKARVTLLPNT